MISAFKQRSTRVGAITFVLAALFVLAAMRVAVLVTFDGARLTSLARNEHTGHVELGAVRGPIVDRNGEPLALSAETRSVYARPIRVLGSTTPAERAELARALGLAPGRLEERLQHRAPFIWLARQVTIERANAAARLGLRGIGTVTAYKRFYPESRLAGSVVGLAGVDGQGLSGLELRYDRVIRGQPVELAFYRDARGRSILDSPLALRGPKPGARLVLTIDAGIQALAEDRLMREVSRSRARAGTAIVLDPFTGEVLAMANVSASPARAGDRLHNAAVQDAFEPGSTMKGILGSIALAQGAVTTGERIYCHKGAYRVGRHVIHDHGRYGWLNLEGIIEVSSNVGAAKIALALGARRLGLGLEGFGFGHKTGIDLPGESGGILRDPAQWRRIEIANHGFGQGLAVTPIQLAVAYAAIANGGLVMRPFVVKSAIDADGHVLLTHTPMVVRRAVAPSVAHTMNELLRSAVEGPRATGRRARVDGLLVAGKTGTAQMVNGAKGSYYQSRLVSSFVGFLPADQPKVVILVVLYDVGRGHFGGLVAAPVFREIAQGALHELDLLPLRAPYDVASVIPFGPAPRGIRESNRDPACALPSRPTGAGGGGDVRTAPNFIRLSLRRALALGRERGVFLKVKGHGYVVDQEPAPGKILADPGLVVMLEPSLDRAERNFPRLAGAGSGLLAERKR